MVYELDVLFEDKELELEVKVDGEIVLDSESWVEFVFLLVFVDDILEVFNRVFFNLFLRWKNWWVRGILILVMIVFFFIIIYLGLMVLMIIVMCV